MFRRHSGFRSVFDRSPSKHRPAVRKRRRPGKISAFESLEPRAMLAILGLPAAGDQSGNPITLIADTLDPVNTLDIVLDDTTNPGSVTATITANGTTVQVWNFDNLIEFTGTDDADDTIDNKVTFTTPYEADVWGFGVPGSLTVTNWSAYGRFASSTPPLADVRVNLFNADSLDSLAGSLGGTSAATIAGEFQSPTDLTVAGRTGAAISVTSNVGITDSGSQAIAAYNLTLTSTNGKVDLDANIATRSDLTIEAQNAPLSLGDVAARSISSTQGDIEITNLVGPITLDNAAILANAGSITVKTPNVLDATVGTSLSVPLVFNPVTGDGLVSLEGLLGLKLPAAMPVTAGRLELITNSVTPVVLNATSVATLRADIGGSLTLTTDVPLTITDFNPLVPSVQIAAQNVTIVAERGIRVVDGFDISGTLCLSTWTGAGVPTFDVEFVTTATGDNPLATAPFAGTLRDMIEYVNANTILPASAAAGVTRQPMSLLFDEPGSPVALGGTVTLQAVLPGLARAVTFDATLPDGTFVALDGGDSVSDGLTLGSGSSGSTVRGAHFHGFTNAGVRIESRGNLLSGLTLGADRGGNVAPNAIGVELSGPQAVQNTIGIGTIGVDTGNRIVANSVAGILVRSGANYNTITGNVIGENGTGLGNLDGIAVLNSIGTIIGGTRPALANSITANTRHGIRLTGVNGVAPAYGTLVVGNEISANDVSGVTIEGGRRNVIGGLTAAAANAITGNGVGVQVVSNGLARTSGNEIYGNVIADNTTGGVLIDQGFGNLVQGNSITDSDTGTSEWGVRIFRASVGSGQGANRVFQNTVSGHGDDGAAAPALTGGIVLENASGQVIGGMGTLANRVTENRGSGIVIVGGVGVNGSTRNVVEGNYVGTDAAGSYLGNAYDGIRIQGGLANTVRANTVRFSDSVANAGVGISIHNAIPATPSLGNVIVSNSVAENDTGILVSGSGGTVVGGPVAGQGNWVFGNMQSGVVVRASTSTGASTGTVIRNNRIGLATRTAAAGNGGFGIDLQSTVGTVVDRGNTVANNDAGGVRVQGGRNITIGSTTGAGNSIWSNLGNGVEIRDPAVPGRTEAVVVAGNDIRDNDGFGVSVAAASAAASRVSAVTIGRPVPVSRPTASTNTIVGNASGGVQVDRAQAVSVVGNSIASNGGPGISLVGGANGGVVAPTLASAAPRVIGQKSPQYDVRGGIGRTGTGTEQQIYLVDLYGTNTATSRQVFLGRVVAVVRAGAASASFRAIVGAAGQRYDQIVATATLGTGTSEFSNAVSL